MLKNTKKNTMAKGASPAVLKEKYHQEIIVKPAKRLLSALLKAEEKELNDLIKGHKSSTSSR